MFNTAWQSYVLSLFMFLLYARLSASAWVSDSRKPPLCYKMISLQHKPTRVSFPLPKSIKGLFPHWCTKSNILCLLFKAPHGVAFAYLPSHPTSPYVPHIPAKPATERSQEAPGSHITLSLHILFNLVECHFFLALLNELLLILSIQFKCNLLWETLPISPLLPPFTLPY